MGVPIAKSLKAIEEIQEAEEEARKLVEKAQNGRQKRIDNANAKAASIVADAEAQSKSVIDEAQRKAMQEVSARRGEEHKDILKMADRLRKKKLPKGRVRQIVDGAMKLIMGG